MEEIIQIIGSSLNNLGIQYKIENPISDYTNKHFELSVQMKGSSILFTYQNSVLSITYSFEQSFTDYTTLQQIQIDFGSIQPSLEKVFSNLK